jgi:hypothetical protein
MLGWVFRVRTSLAVPDAIGGSPPGRGLFHKTKENFTKNVREKESLLKTIRLAA